MAVVAFIAFGNVPAFAASSTTQSLSRQELENLIKANTEELNRVNQQLETTQKNLTGVKSQKATLQRELKQLQDNIARLELSIKSDTIAAEKLGLEIQSINYDIADIKYSIEEKRSTVTYLLRTMQRADQTNLLVSFLKNNSLSDSFFETKSLGDLKSQVDTDIVQLTALRTQLDAKRTDVNTKKASVEDHKISLASKKIIVQDQKEERQTILAVTKDKESLYQQQLAELKKQQDDIADIISKYEEQLKTTFDASLLPTKQHGMFAWPLALVEDGGKGRLTQHFGERSALYRGKPHNGVDIGVPVGTEVRAADAGVVIAVSNNDRSAWKKYQYGKYVLIKHANNIATLYAHLSEQVVKIGATVARGELIGYSGKTGYATGPHLHFGTYWAPSIQLKSIPPAAGLVPIGVVINPEDYL